MKKQLFKVGQIVNTHGIKGEVKIIPLTSDIKRFDYLDKVILEDKELNIEGVKYQKDRVILKLEGIDSIEQAEKLKNKYLLIEREEAIELPEDTYFIADLIGCKVLDTTGFEYGNITEVIQTGSNDVYWVKGNKEVLVPVLKDIVLDINIDEETITIKPIGEWMDED
ncbi:ribosome maturation factor RimM [Clostridium fallax]|uniref:Ribosome maturation factor RimM n=1 Tax=Clostridium fallax TaxID=1533 RepID=A0A1M4UWN1_9CLOT|nr:ribosome maturation factor RimM [Clostridium fallax]SHE61092.1 16S rRNA processing protein RimM [Clostridium fallax]SQB06819.1 16S rRNA-processing protein RimM [Clostridium fallax]